MRTTTPYFLVFCAFVAACSNESAPPRQSASVTPVDAATAGTIRVTVKYAGPAPQPKTINMRSVPACAAAHPEPVLEQSLIVKDGQLVNAVVFIKEGLGGRAFAFPGKPVTFDQKGCIYEPHVAAAMVGQPVEFLNSDPEPHNVHGRPAVVKSWNFIMSKQGSRRTIYFDKPELGIPVGCDIHPWMQAYLSVFDHPYFAVTSGAGAVELKAVPPGEYVVASWHEQLGSREQKIKLDPRATAEVTLSY